MRSVMMKRRREELEIGELGKAQHRATHTYSFQYLVEKALQVEGIHCVEEKAGAIVLNTDDSRINKYVRGLRAERAQRAKKA